LDSNLVGEVMNKREDTQEKIKNILDDIRCKVLNTKEETKEPVHLSYRQVYFK
jgi:hypothetical protein